MSAAAPPDAGPLAGIVVLDLCRLIPGDFTTLLLADLGADVIKLEGPPAGDYLRGIPPMVGEMSALYMSLNRTKRSVRIDHTTERGRELIHSMTEQAHVLVEVSAPGSMARYGLDYDTMRKVNDKLVYCSVTGYGQNGPYSSFPSHGYNIDSAAGMMFVDEVQGRPAVGRESDGWEMRRSVMTVGYTASLAICAALVRAQLSGVGSYIDAGSWDAAIGSDPYRAFRLLNDVPPEDFRIGSCETAKYAPYRASDGTLLLVCAIERKFWKAFGEVLERPDLGDRWAGDLAVDFGDDDIELYDEVQSIIGTKPAAHWEERFEAHGVPYSPVFEGKEAYGSRHAVAREATWSSNGFSYSTPATVVDGVRGRGSVDIEPPRWGEHTAEVLSQFGVAESDHEELAEAGIVEPLRAR